MKRGVQPSTLQKKCDRWKKVLRLGDWDISCRYAQKSEMTKLDSDGDDSCFDDDTIGMLRECSIPEKIALILIRPDYYDHTGHGVSWNIDTLILHELIHIIETIGKQGLPARMRRSITLEKVFEEFNCDTFAAVIYFAHYTKI